MKPAVPPSHKGRQDWQKLSPFFGLTVMRDACIAGIRFPSQEPVPNQRRQSVAQNVARDAEFTGPEFLVFTSATAWAWAWAWAWRCTLC